MSRKCYGAGQDGELPALRDFVQIARRTAACTNYECIYANLAQGTPCDDEQFCTLTDECDGNGTCVGSGTPCGLRDPQCCEGTDECIAPGLPCQ